MCPAFTCVTRPRDSSERARRIVVVGGVVVEVAVGIDIAHVGSFSVRPIDLCF